MGQLQVLLEKYSKKIKIGLVFIFVLLIGLVFIGRKEKSDEKEYLDELTIGELLTDTEKDEEELLTNLEEDEEDGKSEEIEELKLLVDLKGAVASPGVYEMDQNDRVIDCINKGGGFLEEAEETAVNLAQRIEDEMVIYIPAKGEEIADLDRVSSTINKEDSSADEEKIDINKATKEDFKKLNGIGDVKADNIIQYRETNGSFQKIDEIKNISGIGELTFEKLKEHLTVNP